MSTTYMNNKVNIFYPCHIIFCYKDRFRMFFSIFIFPVILKTKRIKIKNSKFLCNVVDANTYILLDRWVAQIGRQRGRLTGVSKCNIVRTVPSYSNTPKRFLLCLHEKPEILHYRNIDELLKGYLWYKTITSQNLSSKAQVTNFFIFQKIYVPSLRYSSFCIFKHPMLYQISDVMISISTRDRVQF